LRLKATCFFYLIISIPAQQPSIDISILTQDGEFPVPF
jgi:hypothetical protein